MDLPSYTFEKHVGSLESTVHDFGPPDEDEEHAFASQEAVFLYGDNTAARFVVRIGHAGMYFMDFTEPGRATTDADRAALGVIRTVVWPAVSAAFGLTALDQRAFEDKLAQKM